MPAKLNIKPGDEFGRYKIVKEIASRNLRRMFLCVCQCGTEREVTLGNLRGSHTRSCGCYMREKASRDKKTHGESHTRIYKIWLGMKKRCFNKNSHAYKHYGGRGITIVRSWLDFNNFSLWAMNNGYQEHLTIERKDHNGNYEPSNCAWIPLTSQMANTRDCKPVFVKGIQFPTIVSAARHFKIPPPTIYNRLRRGIPIQEAFGVIDK